MRISLDQAVTLLNAGQVVGLPTETVYGLAAALSHPAAIDAIFAIKGRPSNNPLIVHLPDAETVKKYALTLPPGFDLLTKAFWPGPLTMVLAANLNMVPDSARAGLPTVAFRVPNHALTRELLLKTPPLVMPSANISGRPSATCAAHIESDFGSEFPVLDGGKCHNGIESTILMWQESAWVILRLGALTAEDFAQVLGYAPVFWHSRSGEKPLCPGQLYRHYAPKAKLHFHTPRGNETVIGFADRQYAFAKRVYSLGSSTQPSEAAHRLYAVLRQLDQDGIQEAWVDLDLPDHGLWQTLKERLHKASM